MQVQDAASFIFAGNATVTVVSKKTQARYTYRVRKAKDGDTFFASLLAGPNNEVDYVYLGLASQRGVRLTAKSRMNADSLPVKALDFAIRNPNHADLEIHHEGRCGRCARKLTVPESIKTGLGPECAKR
jgi:hypothetical protein